MKLKGLNKTASTVDFLLGNDKLLFAAILVEWGAGPVFLEVFPLGV